MENILLIAYYYPPLGGAGVQRTLKFAKYLYKFGYNVCVLTVEDARNGSIRDESLKYEALDGIKIFRAKEGNPNFIINIANKAINKRNVISRDVNKFQVPNHSSSFKTNIKKKIKNILLNIYRSLSIPDDKISWKKEAVKLGNEIIREENIDLIYSTSAPYTCHLIALALAKFSNIPWICDFRDPWALNPFVDYPWFIKKINSNLEKKVVKRSDKVISVSQPIIDDFVLNYKDEDPSKFKVITNGYDEEDFIGYNKDIKPEKFTITYNGTLYGKRSPSNFLEAVTRLIESSKIDKSKIILKFVGEIGRDAKADINNFTLRFGDIVQCIDYLPHKESLKQIENSSALLLIIESGEGSQGIYTGKIFEYIRSGKNIIGIVPDGVAKDLIMKTNTGFCCHPDKINEIEEAINNCYLIWNEDKEPIIFNSAIINGYNRENLSKKLANVMENICMKKRQL